MGQMGCLAKDGMVQLYTGDFKRARFESFILSERARESREAATYIGGGKDIEGKQCGR